MHLQTRGSSVGLSRLSLLLRPSAVVIAPAIPILIVMSLGVAHAQDVRSQPILAGEVTLTTRDVREITALAGSKRSMWMIHSGRACLPAMCIMATIYLRPELETPVLRRGYAMQLVRGLGKDVAWHAWDREWAWAQVASPGEPFGKELEKPSVDTFPFRVLGEIPDQQLVAMVQFVRHPPFYERLFHRLDRIPIKGIEAGPNGVYTVYEEPEFLYIQKLELSSEAGGWKIKSVSGHRLMP